MYKVGPYYPQDSMYYKTHSQMVQEFEEFIRNRSEWDETVPEGTVFEFRMPTHKEVCPQCNGEGTMVNRSVDGNGISAEEFYEDPDFAEAYLSGVYDVVCDECHGKNVVDEIDYEALPEDIAKMWDEWVNDVRDSVAENLAEMRFGA